MTVAFPDPLLHPVVFSTPRRLTHVTSWQEHTPFAMYLVDLLRPGTIVELGTHYGDSYCAFCQAVAELQLPATAYAVDTWTGDLQSGLYADDVLADLRAHHDPLYGGFSELLRSTFDEALPRFQDGSIDILHIDGCHRYEAASHDFESWLPKLSERGVVLLHDTACRLDDFGVWQLRDELRDRFPCLEFSHGNGLGLVLVGSEPVAELVELTRLGGEELAGFCSFFAALGAGVRHIGEVQRSAVELDRLRPEVEELRRQVALLEQSVAEIYNSRLLRLGRRLRPRRDGRDG
jgi:hypothetical protein